VSWQHLSNVKPLVSFFRNNPQAFVLLIVCLILGIGTFLIVIFGLVAAGSGTTNGEPSGAIGLLHALSPFALP
jgi:hypothetical protein